MASVVGAYCVVHSPFCYMPPERWNEVRAVRSLRADVPMEDLETNRAKSSRIQAGFAAVRRKLAEARPDAVVIFGDDQLECFDWSNFPAFGVFVGEEYEGSLSAVEANFGRPGYSDHAQPRGKLKNHPGLAVAILSGLMQRGFDPAFLMQSPKPEVGLGHAFFRPAESLTDMQTPVVPILVNCFFGPQPTAMRCYQLGKAVRESIEAYPEGLRVAVVGSGGLWHTPGTPDAYLDEEFDRACLSYLEKGDIQGAARFFDSYRVPEGDRSQDVFSRGRLSTGMPVSGGPQLGTREFCNWVAAAAAVEGARWRVVDYVPVYASPCGMAFAYSDGAA